MKVIIFLIISTQEMGNNDNKKVLLAISGGIDSAVAIHLLQQEGFNVHCVHFNFWHWETEQSKKNDGVFEKIKNIFGVDISIVDYEDIFRTIVVDQFLADQQMGLTPNPCVQCNPTVKFKLLIDIADQSNVHYIATGHYARVEYDPLSDLYWLKVGLDKKKDQSYMLCYLNQEILSRTILPLRYCHKTDIYKIGKKLGLPITEESESQDLCFVNPENYIHFLREKIDRNIQGDITDSFGRIIGRHNGLHFFTIGQRKGIRVSASNPYYVIEKNVDTNTLIVGNKEELNNYQFEIDQVNWIGYVPQMPYDVDVKIRYQSKRFPTTITAVSEGRLQIKVKEPIQGVTPGQYAVFYDDEIVTGGGRIVR